MGNLGLGSAFEDELRVQEAIEKEAREKGYAAESLIKIWQDNAKIEVSSSKQQKGLVFYNDTRVSVSMKNIQFNQKALLASIIEFALTSNMPQNKAELVKTMLFIIYKVAALSAIEISKEQADVLLYCHRHNAYQHVIPEDKILQRVEGATSAVIDELEKMKCIDIVGGAVLLKERVFVPGRMS